MRLILLPAALTLLLSLTPSLLAQSKDPFSTERVVDFSGLKVTMPTSLTKKPSPDLPASAPIEIFNMHTGTFKGITIVVSDVSYKTGALMNMDSAITGSASAISSLPGVTDVKKEEGEAKVEGANARRASLTITQKDKILRTETLYIIQGMHMWSIQTLFAEDNKDGKTVTEEMFKSVKLKTANP